MTTMDEYLAALQGPESGGNLTIQNPQTHAEGLYQIMPETQAGLRRQGFALDMSTPEGQTRAAAELTRQNDVLLRHRLNRDPTDAERYFAHGFGGPAASYLLANPNMPLETALRTFYGGTRFGERFADRIFEQNPNLRVLRDRPVTEAVADYGNRLHTTGRRQFAGASPPSASPQVSGVPPIRLNGEDVGGGPVDAAVGGSDAASDYDPSVSLMPRVSARPGDLLAEVTPPQPAPMPANTRPRPLPARPPVGRQPAVPPPVSTPVATAGAAALPAVPPIRPGDAPTPAQVGAYGQPSYAGTPGTEPPPAVSTDADMARALLGAQGPTSGVVPYIPDGGSVSGPQPYVSGGPSAIPQTAPAATPPPPPPPGPQLPEVPNITLPPMVMPPEPDYGRLYALIERLSNPTRAPRASSSERGMDSFLAGLGAMGAAGGPGATVGSVIGAGGRATAEARTARGREERDAADRYDQALQEGAARAGGLAATVAGQQQQGALTRAEMAQRQQQFQATSAISLYRAQVARMVAQARMDEAHRRGLVGEPLGTAGQQAILDSLAEHFGPQADARGIQEFGSRERWQAHIATAQGLQLRRSYMRQYLTDTPEGRAMLQQWRGALSGRLNPGTSTIPTDDIGE